MLLYKKRLRSASFTTFQELKTKGIINSYDDAGNLACFSSELERNIFTKEACPVEGMPIDISDISFTMARIDAYRNACQRKRLEDRWRKNVISEFSIALQKSLFNK